MDHFISSIFYRFYFDGSPREETVPVEVLARGQEAVTAFLAAQSLGTLPIYTGRLCVLGQQG